MSNSNYLRKLFTAVDQLLNTIFDGWPDETLSARSYRWYKDGVRQWPRLVINKMFFWMKDHCKSAYTNEQKRMQLPPEYRS